MGRKKTIKLDEMKVTDGKINGGEFGGATSMYDILNIKSHKYKQNNLKDYETYINSLSRADLQNHAYDCQVLPVDSRVKLIDGLVEKFLRETSGYKASSVRTENFNNLHNDPEQLKKVRDIMSRGK